MSLPTEELPKFWVRVDKRGDSDCWNWIGHVDCNGYGRFKLKGPFAYAHRVSYFLVHDELPPCLDHLCRNRKCVNPAHLESVSLGENVLRGESIQAKNACKTHCKRGHPLEGYNLLRVPNGRCCRICLRAAQAENTKKKWRTDRAFMQAKNHAAYERRKQRKKDQA